MSLETEVKEETKYNNELEILISNSQFLQEEEKKQLIETSTNILGDNYEETAESFDTNSLAKFVYLQSFGIDDEQIVNNQYLNGYNFEDMLKRVDQIGIESFCKMIEINPPEEEGSLSEKDEEEILRLIHDDEKRDIISQHLSEIKEYPLLTHQEEIILAKRIEEAKEQGKEDIEAKEILTTSNLRLVISIAKRYIGRNYDFEDIIEDGYVGLMTAVEKYDYRRGTRFSTHATWWIRQNITRQLDNNSNIIRLPVHIRTKLRKIKSFEHSYLLEHGRMPKEEEVKTLINVGKDAMDNIKNARKLVGPLSLDTNLNNDENEDDYTLFNLISENDNKTTEDEIIKRSKIDLIAKQLEKLTPREKRVLELRYGFNDKPHTLKEIGDEVGVSKERIRQIQNLAMRKLKRYLNEYKEDLV